MLGLSLGLGRSARLRLNTIKISHFVSDGLEIHYKPEIRESIIGIEEDVSAINDLSGNNNHATVTGAVKQLQTSSKGNALLSFPYSSANRVDTGVSSIGGSVLHASAGNEWSVYLVGDKSSTFAGYVMSQGNFNNRQFNISYAEDNGGSVAIRINNQTTILATNIKNKLWVIQAHWNGTDLDVGIMIDGESTFTAINAAIGTGSELTSSNIFLGCREASGGNIYNGAIGEFLVYGRALDTEEKAKMQQYFAGNWTNKPYDARIILLGDSIMQGSWDASQDSTAMDIDKAFGVFASAYVDVYEEGDPGETAEFFANNIDTIIANYDPEPYPTYFIGHIGTNNITQTRPFHEPQGRSTALIDGFADDLTYIHNAITTAGYKLFYGQAPFYDRPFPDPDSGNKNGLCVDYQYMGARPYNENVIEPWLNANTPEFCHADGTPYLQFYDLTYNDQTIMSADGIHPSFSGYQKYYIYFAEVVGKAIKGAIPTPISKAADDNITGTKFIIATNNVADPSGTQMNWAAGMNLVGGTLNDIGIVNAMSDPSPFQLEYSSFSSHNTGTRPTYASSNTSLRDSRLQSRDMRSFGNGVSLWVEAVHLPPGATVQVRTVGTTTVNPSRQNVQIEGGALIDANLYAYEPTILSDDVIVPADGRVRVTCADNSAADVVSMCGVSFEVI